MNNDNLEKLRGIYLNEALDTARISSSPLELFDHWMQEAISSECIEPNAFVLSTVDQGRPRSRVVLLKGIEDQKFIFYTNYQSAKGQEIAAGSFVAMNFWWGPLARQVRIEGTIEKVSPETSDAYFQKRPRGSQLGAIASPQSRAITREELEELFAKTEKQYADSETIPRPSHWGGFAIIPHYIEFWQGRANRLHDRVCYALSDKGWEIKRLAP